MKNDLYTKAVLTVIALCLTVLVFKPSPTVASAKSAAPLEVRIVGIDEGLGERWEPIPIEIKDVDRSAKLKVTLEDHDLILPLPVRVER